MPKRIEAGPTTDIVGNTILYNDIDTLGGNSGSGILRASDGRLVGIHTNGGCGPTSPSAGGGSNLGQRIAAVIAASPTLQALIAKSKFSDDPIKPTADKPILDTPVTLKFRDDISKPVLDKPIRDTPVTLKFRDDIPKLKVRDDVKLPALDKRPASDAKLPGSDNFDPFNRGRFETRGGARPFILSNPHHSYAWQGGYQQESNQQQQIEAQLLQYEQALAAAQDEIEQLDAEYRELLAYYESIRQGGQ
jgi:hypothetical protein